MKNKIKDALENLYPEYFVLDERDIEIKRNFIRGVFRYIYVKFYMKGRSKPGFWNVDGKQVAVDGEPYPMIGTILIQFDNDEIDASMRSASL